MGARTLNTNPLAGGARYTLMFSNINLGQDKRANQCVPPNLKDVPPSLTCGPPIAQTAARSRIDRAHRTMRGTGHTAIETDGRERSLQTIRAIYGRRCVILYFGWYSARLVGRVTTPFTPCT